MDDDKKKLLKDGEKLRVPLMVMDATQRAIASANYAAHRPGYRGVNDADRRHAVNVTRKAMLSDAWRTTPTTDERRPGRDAYVERLNNAWRG